MAGIPSDYTIIGTVLAIAVSIILLSGLALYIAFRVRETLREEKGGGARAAKVAFLIGLLFLSGGVFYFFASGFNASAGTGTQSTSSTTSIGSSHKSSSSSSSSTTSTSSSSTTSSTSTSTTTNQQGVSMVVQCPSSGGSVHSGQTFSCTFAVYNVGGSAFQSATLTSSGDLSQFSFQACSETVNGASSSCLVVSSIQLSIGTINPGTTVVSASLIAPMTAGQKSCVITLAAPGMSQPYSVSFTIQATH